MKLVLYGTILFIFGFLIPLILCSSCDAGVGLALLMSGTIVYYVGPLVEDEWHNF